jgi:hypothetical protein
MSLRGWIRASGHNLIVEIVDDIFLPLVGAGDAN